MKSHQLMRSIVTATTMACISLASQAQEAHPPYGQHERFEQERAHHDHGSIPFEARHIERLLDDVKASDAQRAQIRQIGDKARAELKALQERFAEGREQGESHEHSPGFMNLLTQAKVDATGAEKERQLMVSHQDEVSKLILQATVNIANALTPEQRVFLGQEREKQLARMKQWHGEPHAE